MATYAGRPVLPSYFVDTTGDPQESVSVTVYLRGTTTLATLYTDRTKATTTANPTTTDAFGNFFPFLDPGDYDVVVNGATIPFSAIPDPAEPLDTDAVLAVAANTDDVPQVEKASAFATGGTGTAADPWTSPSGTGGLRESLDASAISGLPAYWSAGYYLLTASALTGFFSGCRVRTDGRATVLVATAGQLTDSINMSGTEATPNEDMDIGGFHVDRTAGKGRVLCTWVNNSRVGDISGEGSASGLTNLRVRHVTGCKFGNVRGVGNGANPGGLSVFNATDCQFGDVYSEGGHEALDVSAAVRCQFGWVIGLNQTEETLDLGGCDDVQIAGVISYNSWNGATLKTESSDAEVPIGGDLTNVHIGTMVIRDHSNRAILATNTIAEMKTIEGLTIGNLDVMSSGSHTNADTGLLTGAIGLEVRGGTLDANLPIRRFTVKKAHVVVTGTAFLERFTEDLDVTGYFETTGDGTALPGNSGNCVMLDGTGIVGSLRAKVNITCKGSGTTDDMAAFWMSRHRDFDFKVHVVSSNSHGVRSHRSKVGRIHGRIEETQGHGVAWRVVDEVEHYGSQRLHINVECHNTGKLTSGATKYGVFVYGTPTTVAVEDAWADFCSFTDDQATPTTRGVRFEGATARCTRRGNTYGASLASPINSGAVGTGGFEDYVGTDSAGLAPTASLATGTADASSFLRGDRTWAVPGTATHTHGVLLGSDGADAEAINTTTETTLATIASPTVVVGDILRLSVFGDMLNDSGAAVTFLFRFKLGTTTVLSSPAISLAASANPRRWRAEVDVLVVAVATQQRTTALLQLGSASGNAWASSTAVETAIGYASTAVDLATTKNVILTVQMGTAHASARITRRGVSLEHLRKVA